MPEDYVPRPSAWSRWTLLGLATLMTLVGAAGVFGERHGESAGFAMMWFLLLAVGIAALVWAGYYAFGYPSTGPHTPRGMPTSVATVPAVWTRSGELTIGVTWRGVLHRRFTVGIKTPFAKARAMANLPPWLDFRTVWRYSVSTWSEEELLEAGQQKIVLSEDETRIGSEMATAWYHNLVAHRVVRLGSIPPELIPEACRSLCESDMQIIVAAAEELDAALDRYLATSGANAPLPEGVAP